MALSDDLLAVLNDPLRMWSHALKELSRDSQRLFLTLTLLPTPVSVEVLRTAYGSQTVAAAESFLDSLRSLEDSFISIEQGRSHVLAHGVRQVSFKNPSLQDFAKAHINDNLDWLGTLLSNPVFYDQITSIFSLAMAQSKTINVLLPRLRRARIKESRDPKYPDVKRWVDSRSDHLIELAVKLINADSARLYSNDRSTKISSLLEITTIFGMPSKITDSELLKSELKRMLNPSQEHTADRVIDLLNDANYKELMDRIIGEDSAAAMRDNVVQQQFYDWKYKILYKLDSMLHFRSHDSWEAWGNDYADYANQLADELVDSDNRDDIRNAIDEMNNIGNMLGLDLSERIEELEGRRDSLPSLTPDFDEEDESESGNEATPGGSDASTELDRIFGSLL